MIPLPRARPHRLGEAMRVGVRGMDLILSRSTVNHDLAGSISCQTITIP